MFHTGAVTVRKEYLERVGGFDESLRWGEEWDLQVRLAQLGPIGMVPQLAVDYLCRENSICSTANPQKFESGARMFARWRRTIPGLPTRIKQSLRSQEHEFYLLAAQVHLENRREATRALSCALSSWKSGMSMWSLRSTIRMTVQVLRSFLGRDVFS